MHNATSPQTPPDALETVAAAVILVLAAALRFHHLDTPSLWPDELLVAVVSQHPIGYILEWARRLEVHPPGFHLLIKLASQAGTSDMALRFVSAACGTATVAVLWRLGRTVLPPTTALFATALAAASPLLVWVSRQVRPYGVLVLCITWSLFFLIRFLSHGRRRDLWLLCAANLPVLWLHYLAVLVVAAQGAAWMVLRACRRTPVTWRQAASFAGLTALSFAPVLPFFLAMLGRGDMTTPRPFDACLAATLDNFEGVLDFFRLPAVAATVAGLAGLGAVVTFLTRRVLCVCCLSLILVPLGAVLAARYGTFYFSSHLSFMVVPVALLAAAGLGFCLRSRVVNLALAVALTAGLGATLVTRDAARLYAPDSNVITWWHFGVFKTIARQFLTVAPPGDAVLFTDSTVRTYTNWYLDRFATPNPVRRQRLEAGRSRTALSLVTLQEDFGHLPVTAASLAAHPAAAGTACLDSLEVRRFLIPRHDTTLAALPASVELTADPFDFYARIHAAEGLAIDPFQGGALFPTRPGQPGSAVMRYAFAPGTTPGTAQAVCAFTSQGTDDVVRLYAAQGIRPEQLVAEYTGPGGGVLTALIHLEPDARQLDLRLELTSSGNTPIFSVDNLRTVQARRLTTAFCDAADVGPCAESISRAIQQALRERFLAESFRTRPVAGQTTSFGEASRREDSPPESDGFSHIAPRSDDTAVTVRVLARDVGKTPVFYPRLGGEEARVTVWRIDADGLRSPIFSLQGPPRGWTPVSAQYALPVPTRGPVPLEIVLEGRGAQLWHKDGFVVFTP